MNNRNSPTSLNKSVKNFLFFLEVSAAVILFLLTNSFLLSIVEIGNKECDGCSYCSQMTSNPFLRKFSTVSIFEDKHFEDDDLDDPFYDSPETNFEHKTNGWSFNDALFYNYGVMSTTGSSFQPTTTTGLCITYLEFLIGIPMVSVFIAKIKDFLKILISYLAKIAEKKMTCKSNTKRPLPYPTQYYQCPIHCRQCHDAWKFQQNDFYQYVDRSHEPPTHKRTTRYLNTLFPGHRIPPRIVYKMPARAEKCNKNKEANWKFELCICLFLCHLFCITTVFLFRQHKSTIMDTVFSIIMWIATAGTLEFRTGSTFENLLTMFWGLLGISILGLTTEMLAVEIEHILWKVFELFANILQDDTEDNDDNDDISNHNSPQIMYFDPCN